MKRQRLQQHLLSEDAMDMYHARKCLAANQS